MTTTNRAHPRFKRLNVWFLALAFLPLGGCATEPVLRSPAVEGRVVDADTHQPIPGALVVVRWQGHVGWTGTVCFHVETGRSDEQGYYRIPAWEKPSPYGKVKYAHYPIAYKPGYEDSYPEGDTARLKPFKGTRAERLAYLDRLEYSTRCSSEDSKKNMLPFYHAAYDEAKRLVVTKGDRKIADGFLANIEIAEVGYEAAMKRAVERAEKREQEQ